MRPIRLFKRESAINDRLYPAGFKQRPHLLLQPGRNGALECDRPRPQGRPGYGQPPPQHLAKIGRRLGSSQQSNNYQPAVVGQSIQFARQVVARHHVKNHINPLAAGCRLDPFDKIIGAVVDRQFRAERNACCAFLI
jgi:hypothetical protein